MGHVQQIIWTVDNSGNMNYTKQIAECDYILPTHGGKAYSFRVGLNQESSDIEYILDIVDFAAAHKVYEVREAGRIGPALVSLDERFVFYLSDPNGLKSSSFQQLRFLDLTSVETRTFETHARELFTFQITPAN